MRHLLPAPRVCQDLSSLPSPWRPTPSYPNPLASLPSRSGFKATTDRRWVHLFCALLAPQTVIHNLRDMDMIDISSVPIQARTRKQAGGSAVNTPSSRSQAPTPRSASALPSLKEEPAVAEGGKEEDEKKPAAMEIEQPEEGKEEKEEGKEEKEDKEDKEEKEAAPMEVCAEEGQGEATEAKPTAEATQDPQPPSTDTAIVPAGTLNSITRNATQRTKPLSTSPLTNLPPFLLQWAPPRSASPSPPPSRPSASSRAPPRPSAPARSTPAPSVPASTAETRRDSPTSAPTR